MTTSTWSLRVNPFRYWSAEQRRIRFEAEYPGVEAEREDSERRNAEIAARRLDRRRRLPLPLVMAVIPGLFATAAYELWGTWPAIIAAAVGMVAGTLNQVAPLSPLPARDEPTEPQS